MKYVFTIILVITVLSGNTQPTFGWVKAIGNTTGNAHGRSIAKDAAGNVYMCGNFQPPIDFDPGSDEVLLTPEGILDIFIMKLNPAGDFLWAKRIGGAGNDQCTTMLLDASGNITLTGIYSESVDFDPGAGVFEMTSVGERDIFIMKLNGDGEFLWAKSIGGTNNDSPGAMVIDNNGNLVICGTYRETVDFDPGSGIANLSAGITQAAFILTLNAAGEYIWATTFTSTGFAACSAVTLDAAGDIYIAGSFGGQADFDPGPGENKFTANGMEDGYFLKMEPSGNILWLKILPLEADDAANAITVNAAGDIYIGGRFRLESDFDPGPGVFMMAPVVGPDGYICKFDAAGNFVWARRFGGGDADDIGGLALDNQGNIYAVGNFRSQLRTGPAPGTLQFSTAGETDIFVIKIDAAGNFIWAQQIGGSNREFVAGMLVTGIDDLYVAGIYSQSTDFDADPGPGTELQPGYGPQNSFFLYLKGLPTLPLTLLDFKAINNKNDVLLQWKTEQEIQVLHFDLERSADGKHFTSIGKTTANNLTHTNQYAFTDAAPLPGANFYRLKIMEIDRTQSYSRVVVVKRNQNSSRLQVFPNPVKDILYIQIPDSETVPLEIADPTGRIVVQRTVTLQSQAAFPLNLQQLAPGRYYLVLKSKTGKKTAGFVKY